MRQSKANAISRVDILLYVHKDYQHQGIGALILNVLEDESQRQNKNALSSDVSITARPFFEKHGYRVLKKQKKLIDGIGIVNYKMVK
jgi:putative acetyltransferase